MIRAITAAMFSLLLFFSCKNNGAVPSGILKPEKMQAVLWDIVRADVFTENFISKDSSKNSNVENIKFQNRIFHSNNVTREAYYESYEYYKKNPVLMNALLDSISVRAVRDHSNPVTVPVLKTKSLPQ